MNKKIVGYKEKVTIGIKGNMFEVSATMDTGNGGVVPTLSVNTLIFGKPYLRFNFEGQEFTLEYKGESSTIVGGKLQKRPIVILDYIIIDGQKISEPKFALSEKRKSDTNILLNRDTINKFNLLMDSSLEFTI